jgi:O-antigen biosynthesis protein
VLHFRKLLEPGALHDLGQMSAPKGAAAEAPAAQPGRRVRVDGKFFRMEDRKFWVKGVTYGPFRPLADSGEPLPPLDQIEKDFAQIRGLGGNTLRVYHVPPRWFLDTAQQHDLKVFVDIPWSKHRCFLDDRADRESGRQAVRSAARGLKGHPALFALSVVNEIPTDVARWLGREKVEGFIDELVDIARQEDPEVLATFASFPPTEYLHPQSVDFYTMNVYLHKRERFRAYLERLQNQADEKPLLLGEYGIDSIRNGEQEQAELVDMHLSEVFRAGLAGTCVFSFTDEWFTGGHPITDWAFGLVGLDRAPKPVFERVAEVFHGDPRPTLSRYPRVSVVVCSYNGSKTLDGCLRSLMRLDYPEFEIILVDDGSTDKTPEIAACYPLVRYHRQKNRGLSVARNVGMDLATGEIIAYTDDDCFADEDWLYYLVGKLLDSEASGVGGPNFLPTKDGPVAACVSASPGTPAHILIDDSEAEHVPGCNMAFWADRLRAIGGFDPVYTKAGDDVDVCWRLQAEGERIVYNPAAMVWHHRRATVAAYLKQQRGYGQAEALLKRKHPEKFRGFRADLSWSGRIYTRAGLGLNVGAPSIHFGIFGAGMFQTIYSAPQVWWPLMVLGLEWWVPLCLMLGLAPFVNPLAALAQWGVISPALAAPILNPLLVAPLLMLLATVGVSYWVAGQASPPLPQRRLWSRLLIAAMHIAQPVERGWARYSMRFRTIEIPSAIVELRRMWEVCAGHLLRRDQLDLWSESWVGREKILDEILSVTSLYRWFVRVDPGWSPHDIRFYGDRWCKADLTTVTENHGGGRLLTRIRLLCRPTFFQKVSLYLAAYALLLAASIDLHWAGLLAPLVVGWMIQLRSSEKQLRSAVMATILTVAKDLELTAVGESDLLGRLGSSIRRPDARPVAAHEPAPILRSRRLPVVNRGVKVALGQP